MSVPFNQETVGRVNHSHCLVFLGKSYDFFVDFERTNSECPRGKNRMKMANDTKVIRHDRFVGAIIRYKASVY